MGWPMVKLGEVLTHAPQPVPVSPEQSYPNLGLYSYARGAFLKPPIDGMQTSARTLYKVRAKQFIYSRLFAFEGAYTVVPDEMDGFFVSNEYPTFDHDGERLFGRYLSWLFAQPSVWRSIASGSKGMGDRRQRVHPEQVLSFRIPLPPLDEQRRIAARLDRVAALVDEVRGLRQSVDVALDGLVQSLHFDRADTTGRPLSEFIELQEDRQPVEPDRDYPQVGLRGFGGGLFHKGATAGRDTKYRAFNLLHPDMLVVSQPKGWEGAVAIASADFAGWFASPEYRTFTCRADRLLPKYMAALIRTPWFQSALGGLTRGQGARRERLRPEMLLALEVRMPSITAQSTILGMADSLASVRRHSSASSSDFDALLPALLHEEFGECT